ncbi:MAG: hypothetical protein WC602_04895 [archaeon]
MFLLQQGWGMIDMIRVFLQRHPSTGVILSPRICEREQMEYYVPSYSDISGTKLLFDPHFYEPHTHLKRILSYPYYQDYNFQTQTFDTRRFCENVISYQTNILGLDSIILPGRYVNSLTEPWLQMQHDFAHIGSSVDAQTVYSTVAVGPDVIMNSDNFNTIIDEVVNYPVNGIYFVFEHLNNDFLLNEEFLYIILDGLLSIVLSGKHVIVGYSNQQCIALVAAGVDCIASGNYRNVRAFDHLNSTDRDDTNLRKGLWYFDGNTFGEYKIPALSLAFRRDLKQYFGPSTQFATDLLESSVPTSIVWREPDAFRHYFELMYQYCQIIFAIPKKDRAQYILEFFKQRERVNVVLKQRGFTFGDRGFDQAVLSTISALESFISDRKSELSSLYCHVTLVMTHRI